MHSERAIRPQHQCCNRGGVVTLTQIMVVELAVMACDGVYRRGRAVRLLRLIKSRKGAT
jgi:hypothetical protein